MKNLFTFLTILTMMALASCSSLTESSSESGNAALDLYYQYADRENLTVACLGDSSANPVGEKKVSIGLEIDANFVSELGLDTITDLGQVDEERFNRMIQIIADTMREVVNATVAGDSPVMICGYDLVNHHNALADAEACAWIAREIL